MTLTTRHLENCESGGEHVILFRVLIASILVAFLTTSCHVQTIRSSPAVGSLQTPRTTSTELVVASTATFPNTPEELEVTPTFASLLPLPNGDPPSIVGRLLEGNQGCRLPCWWGMIPGELTWQMALSHLEPITLRTSSVDDSRHPGSSFHQVVYPLPDSERAGASAVLDLAARGGVIVRIVAPPPHMGYYTAAMVTRDYGVPTEAYVWTFSEPREGSLPFGLVLVYRDARFVADFYAEGRIRNGNVEGCVDQSEATITAWSPGDDQLLQGLRGLQDEGILAQVHYEKIADATGVKMDLLPSLLNESSPFCLSTPASDWPPPT